MIRTAESTYNNQTKEFSFDVLFGNAPGSSQTANGYWLAVSPGPNPKGRPDELALFYLDASKSQPVLTAYTYNGLNGDNSWSDGSPAPGTQAPDLILSSKKTTDWIKHLSVTTESGGRRMKMVVDATRILSHVPANVGGPNNIWTGDSFADKFGIWFQPTRGLEASYNSVTGYLKSWSYRAQGWRDGESLQAVRESMTMTALGLGVAALARRRAQK